MCIPIKQTSSQIVTSSNVETSTHDVSHLNDDFPASPTESLLHAAASSSDPQPSSYLKRLGMANHWRNAVDGEEELYFNRVADTMILKVIEPECTTSQGVSHEYDPLAVQVTLQGFGDKGDPGRLLGYSMAKLTTYVDGSTHVEGTAELGSWEDVDEVSVPVEGHQPGYHGEIEDLPYQPRNPLPKQPFGYTTEDLYTGSGWDFYSYGPPYTPMYSRPSPLETVAQAGSSISHCSSGPVVVDTSDLEASTVIPPSDPSPKLESAPSIPQNSISWEPRCRKLFRSFSVNAEKELAEVGRFIRFLRPEIRS